MTFSKAFTLMLAFLACANSFGQKKTKTSVSWGEPVKSGRKMAIELLAYSGQDGYLVQKGHPLNRMLRSAFKKNYFELFTPDLKSAGKVKLSLGRDYVCLVPFKDNAYIIGIEVENKNKRAVLSYAPFSVSGLKTNGSFFDFSEFSTEDRAFDLTAGPVPIDVEFTLSRDSSKVAFMSNYKAKKGHPEKFNLAVCEDDMSLIWENTFTLPYEDKLFYIDDYIVDNSGNVHILGKKFFQKQESKARAKEGNAPYEYMLLSITNEGDDLSEFVIDVEGKPLMSLRVALNYDGEVSLAGIWADPNNTKNAKGFCYVILDYVQQDVKSMMVGEFDIDFLTLTMSDSEAAKTKKKEGKAKPVSKLEHDVTGMVFRSDGSVLILAEQNYAKTIEYRNSKGEVNYVDHYYFNDIILIDIAADGSSVSANKIAKRQHSVNDRGAVSSYSMCFYKDKMYFIFNDSPKNMGFKGRGVPAMWSVGQKTVLMLVEVDAEGKQKRKALFTAPESSAHMLPSLSRQVSSTEFLFFYSRKKKKSQFGKVTFV